MRLALFIVFVCFLGLRPAYGAELSGILVQEGQRGVTQVLFEGDAFKGGDISLFEIDGHRPRLVVDFKKTSSSLLRSGNYNKSGEGSVETVRAAKRSKHNIRVVLDLKPGNHYSSKDVRPDRVIVSLKGPGTSQDAKIFAAATSKKTVASRKDIPTPRIKPKIAAKKVIVIDAGHGGRDPGALGGLGLREKKVTLAAALELKRQLDATGKYKVVLTRGDDRYIEHEDRLRMARANNADLFISLHADATVGKSARGASVYTLADRAKNRSKKIVNSQNWIMDVNLSEQTDKVGDILVDLAQRDTFSQSTRFADILIKELGETTKLLRNTHRRAGYYVLLAPDVPAVLLELGFISNPIDEKLLKSESHRRKLMSSVVSAINKYFDR